MANKDKFYVVFVGRTPGMYTTWLECQTQVIGYKGNGYKSYRTHHEVVSAWVMYEPRQKKPNTLIESSAFEEVNKVIGQLEDDQVVRKIED